MTHPATTAAQDWKEALNDAQRRAVEHSGSPLVVLAGPGTGKTRVIIARIRHLLEGGADPKSILALTFSVKAAEEMRQRLAAAVGHRVAERVQMSTFHAFGASIVRRFGAMIGRPPRPTLMDSAQRKRLLRRLIIENRLFEHMVAHGRDLVTGEAEGFIQDCRNNARTPDDALAHAAILTELAESNPNHLTGDELESLRERALAFREHARLFGLWDKACADHGLVTFDDYLSLPLRVFEHRPGALAILRSELRHVLVDEFQDSNGAQIELLRRLCPPGASAPDLCVVGDDDQAIYGFRGADPHSFDRFAAIWTDQTTISLSQNYRSSPPIIDASNAVISRAEHRFRPDKVINPARTAHAPAPGLVPLEGVTLDDDGHHGAVIASMILAERERDPERPWSSFGVLAATNDYVEQIAETLRGSGIPVAAIRRLTPLDDPGVRDLQAWMDLVGGAAESSSVARLLAPRPPYSVPIDRINQWQGAWRRSPDGRTFLEWLTRAAGPDLAAAVDLARLALDLRQELFHRPADAAVEEIIRRADLAHAEDLDPRARAARVRHLVQVLRFVRSRQPLLDPPGGLASFLDYYSDLSDDEKQFEAPGDERLDASDTDTEDGASGEGVRVLTAHKAKGLEFHTVFIAKVRPGGFPPTRRARDERIAADEFLGRSRSSESDEARRLFYVACTRAERRLVLLAKNKKGQGDATDYFFELTQDTPGLRFDLSPGAAWLARPGSPADASDDLARETAAGLEQTILSRETNRARQEAAAALHDARNAAADPGRLPQIEARLAISARAIAAIEHLRLRRELPEEALSGDLSRTPLGERLRAAAERIAKGLGPASLTAPLKAPLELSYSKLIDYDKCPRCFYAKYILKLDEARSGEISVGTIVHDALEVFYRRLTEAESEGVATPGLAELLRAGADAFERHWPLSLPVDPIAREKIDAQLRLAYGKLHDDAQVLFLERTQRFRYAAAGAEHVFTAKVDRIDRLPDGRFRIVDYKTGKPTQGQRNPEPDDLQLCTYALAMREILEIPEKDPMPDGVAEYWCLAEGVRGTIALADLRLDKAHKEIEKAARAMIEGRFERKPRTCKGLCGIMPAD